MTPTSPSAAPSPSTPRASRSWPAPPAAPARKRPRFPAATASRPASSSSTTCSCPTTGSSWPARSKRPAWPPSPMPPTTAARPRLAHDVSGGLVVALPGPDEDHNPETAASLEVVLAGRADIPAAARREVARLVEDLTASYAGSWYSVISLHGGGSPEAMKREIWRNYPVGDKVDLVERLLDRGVAGEGAR